MKPIQLTEETINIACDNVRQYLTGARLLTGKVEVQLPTYGVCKEELKPTIVFTKKAEERMKALVRLCNTEVGWHGTVTYDAETNTYTIHDILVFPQTITGTTVNSIDEEYGPWLMGLTDEVFSKLRFHGHSHVNMGVFASATDTNHQETLIESVDDFYIFMIINKKNEVAVFLYDKINNIMYDTKDINVVFSKDKTDKWATKAMDKYLVKPKPVVTQYSRPVYNQYSGRYSYEKENTQSNNIQTTLAAAQKQMSTYESMLRETKPYLYSYGYTQQGGYYE